MSVNQHSLAGQWLHEGSGCEFSLACAQHAEGGDALLASGPLGPSGMLPRPRGVMPAEPWKPARWEQARPPAGSADAQAPLWFHPLDGGPSEERAKLTMLAPAAFQNLVAAGHRLLAGGSPQTEAVRSCPGPLVPLRQAFRVGNNVEAKPMGDAWYIAAIAEVRPDGTYLLDWAAIDSNERVRSRGQLQSQSGPAPFDVAPAQALLRDVRERLTEEDAGSADAEEDLSAPNGIME